VEIGSCSGSSGHAKKSSMGKKTSSIPDVKGMFKGKEYIRVGITTHWLVAVEQNSLCYAYTNGFKYCFNTNCRGK